MPATAVRLLALLALLPAFAGAESGWFPWRPPAETAQESAINLRYLNEKFAGENGWIQAKGEQFVHSRTGAPVRFWAVNGPPGSSNNAADWKEDARVLSRHGVNLVRLHYAPFDNKTGQLRPDAGAKKAGIVAAMKDEGIYSLFSIYFPLWLKPEAGPGWREGYDGVKHPFALLYFEPEFQNLYREWWKTLLTTKDGSGRALLEDPAVMGIELVNEDSFFFWTFNYRNVPDPQMRKLEKRFGDWAAKKHGSLRSALAAWKNQRHERDDEKDGRLGFRTLHDLVNVRSPRDQDTAAFLFETQRDFYADTVKFIRGLGYKGLITASNWITADADILGPLEKLSYMPGDFIDHHGYLSTNHKGENASWSIRPGHTYSDVSALRFDAQTPGQPKKFSNPAMDPMYNRRPSMISEIAWNRPNRHRGEAPLFLAAYGALQDTDSIVHFAFDGRRWQVKPRFHMQPWTLMAPTQMGQFPAAALIYRQGLVKTGDLVADLRVKIADLLALKGAGFGQQANLDELRKADLEGSADAGEKRPGLDPLLHLVGRVNIEMTEAGGRAELKDASPFIDRRAQTVRSSTSELTLDYGRGLLAIDAPSAQGLGGHLSLAGETALKDIAISSPMELGYIVAVSLDGRPLADSGRILLQVMSEEKATGFATEPAGEGVHRITDIGRDPWLVREFAGTVRFRRADAERLKVMALDLAGRPDRPLGDAREIALLPDRAYYLITR